MTHFYPMLVEPRFDERIWGGDYLAARLGKSAPPHQRIGESWEIYDENRIVNGAYAGKTIAELRRAMGEELMGRVPVDRPFPLLTKLIDARDALSVQVHPDDRFARLLEHEPNGKTECWYVVHAAPGAEITYGFSRDTSPDEYEQLVASGRLEDILRSIQVKAGDVVYIPAGTVHAIGSGIVVFELQQTSDVTYRIYDWNRRDASGKPRELHVAKARQVLDYYRWTRGAVRPLRQVGGRTPLVAGPYFSMELVEAAVAWDIRTDGYPIALLALDQRVVVFAGNRETVILPSYSSALIPASARTFRLEPQPGNQSPAWAIACSPKPQDATRADLLERGYNEEEVEGFLAQFAAARDLGKAAAG